MEKPSRLDWWEQAKQGSPDDLQHDPGLPSCLFENLHWPQLAPFDIHAQQLYSMDI